MNHWSYTSYTNHQYPSAGLLLLSGRHWLPLQPLRRPQSGQPRQGDGTTQPCGGWSRIIFELVIYLESRCMTDDRTSHIIESHVLQCFRVPCRVCLSMHRGIVSLLFSRNLCTGSDVDIGFFQKHSYCRCIESSAEI